MERKYKIQNSSIVMPVTIDFLVEETGQTHQIQTHVDMMNDRVFFLGSRIYGIDYEDLEQEILMKVRPNFYQTPRIPEGMEEKMKKLMDSKSRGSI